MRAVRVSLRALVVGSTVLAGVVCAGTAPAGASAADGYVRGAGYQRDDWGDEGTLSTAAYSNTGVTCLWQKVLESEGYTLDSGPDGKFGAETKAATRRLQVRWGLADDYASADGKVGPVTFGKADDHLSMWETGTGETRTLKYDGKLYSFWLYRSSSGLYFWKNAAGSREYAAYSGNPCR
ncbi:peptidoglycan-binding protein [Streptomyces sp. NPDC050400]|uniref:peptidoglycan-binding protein n=1 Tax=Streptomyces sp. NPDC050400 TaxID=3365610 RepID=UPI0037A80C8D